MYIAIRKLFVDNSVKKFELPFYVDIAVGTCPEYSKQIVHGSALIQPVGFQNVVECYRFAIYIFRK